MGDRRQPEVILPHPLSTSDRHTFHSFQCLLFTSSKLSSSLFGTETLQDFAVLLKEHSRDAASLHLTAGQKWRQRQLFLTAMAALLLARQLTGILPNGLIPDCFLDAMSHWKDR